jgi:hypothetical protein
VTVSQPAAAMISAWLPNCLRIVESDCSAKSASPLSPLY